MTIDDIIEERERLDRLLRQAVATMEKKDTINTIRAQMRLNQSKCPHFSTKYNYTMVDGICPYCGKSRCVPKTGEE